MASMILLQTQFSIVSQTVADYNHGNLYSDVAHSKRQYIKLYNRELQILRRGRQRIRDFLNTECCSRVNQRVFGVKT